MIDEVVFFFLLIFLICGAALLAAGAVALVRKGKYYKTFRTSNSQYEAKVFEGYCPKCDRHYGFIAADALVKYSNGKYLIPCPYCRKLHPYYLDE